MTEENVVKLNIDLLEPSPYQPRKQFNENSLKELALSIREYGILNPILVRQNNDKYEIIAGERRYRAAKLLNLKEVPVIVKDISDELMTEIALTENLQRENITPIEEAMTYQAILKKTNKTEKELSEMIGKSQPFIANKIRLLNLPQNVQDALINKKISERHARSLLSVKEEEKQTELLEKIIREKLTVKELDLLINKKDTSDEEIHSAVNEIINSLNDSDNKKEEKESDNMNNGNFFPNFNNDQNINNNNNAQASLNSMNMQTMNNGFTYNPQNQTEVQGEQQINVMPQVQENNNVVPPLPEQPQAMPSIEPIQPVNVVSPIPTQNVESISPIPNFDTTPPTPEIQPSMPQMNETMPVMPSQAPETVVSENPEPTPLTDIPLFNSPDYNQQQESTQTIETQPSMPQPAVEAVSVDPILNQEPVAAEPIAPINETPLFNPELSQQVAEQPEIIPGNQPEANTFNVPITEEQPQTIDKFTEVKELLNNNGISFKAYSNETNHCIIIEL